MLILTRKSDESIIIGNNIEVKVLKIQGNQVQIGINAPKDISIYRQEIFEQIIKENESAVRNHPDNQSIKDLEHSLSDLKDILNKQNKEPK